MAGSYKFNSISNNLLSISVSGKFEQADAERYINDYKKTIAKINPQNCILDLDCTSLNVSTPDVIPMLQACFEMYKADGFNNVRCKILNNGILKMQLSRMARTANLKDFEVYE